MFSVSIFIRFYDMNFKKIYVYMQISVNGSHFCDFRHRIEKHHVNTLTIEGGVQISSIRFDGAGSRSHGVGGFLGRVVGEIAKV